MIKKKILIINGPNLNLLGERESSVYGKLKLKDLYVYLKKYVLKKDVIITFFQSNEEGKIIESIHKARKTKEGIIINAGAYIGKNTIINMSGHLMIFYFFIEWRRS